MYLYCFHISLQGTVFCVEGLFKYIMLLVLCKITINVNEEKFASSRGNIT